MKAFFVYWAQLSSVATTVFILNLLGEPAWYQGNIVHLGNVSLGVAPGCCGPNAGLALLATAMSLALVFLRSPWARALLILVAVPLSILRNGIRIATIAMLCEHLGPQMIHSWVHTQGGPVFFVLSLVPLIILLHLLRISQNKRRVKPNRKEIIS